MHSGSVLRAGDVRTWFSKTCCCPVGDIKDFVSPLRLRVAGAILDNWFPAFPRHTSEGGERPLPALRVTRHACKTVGVTVHVRLSAEVSIHLSAEVGADIAARTGWIIAQVSADLGNDASADAGGIITHT